MRIDTWIDDELVTLDTEDTWGRVFAEWEQLVPTDIAEQIANETVLTLRRYAAGDPQPVRSQEKES